MRCGTSAAPDLEHDNVGEDRMFLNDAVLGGRPRHLLRFHMVRTEALEALASIEKWPHPVLQMRVSRISGASPTRPGR